MISFIIRISLEIIGGICLLYMLAIMPRMVKRPDTTLFKKVYFAHRGLHDNAGDAPENSMAAFRKAVEAGLGMELDVQVTKDGVPVIFHDFKLDRICGAEGKIKDYTYEELQAKYGKLPGALHSFSPILLPIILIALASVASFPGNPFGTGFFFTLITFIGKPEVALILGVFLATSLIPSSEKENTLKWVTQRVTDSAAILAITGAGGSFGAILKLLPIADSVGGLVNTGIGILIPFIIAMILKLAMGASTVAMITTAGMMAPLMASMGFTSPVARVLVVLAIGAGSMVASHANDSYFWVVSQFSDMKTEEAYKCQTGMTAVMGITIIILLFIVSLFV